jgi:hypothetical protein
LFELHPGGPGFFEAGRNDHCARDTRFSAFADYLWNGKRGRNDHGQIHWGWDISNPWEGFYTKYIGSLWVDGVKILAE